MSSQLVKKKSKIAGDGLFAARIIKAGENIEDQRELPFEDQIGFNHSCVPNVTTTPRDHVTGWDVVAVRDIKKGEELTLNYHRHGGGGVHEKLNNGTPCNCPLHQRRRRQHG